MRSLKMCKTGGIAFLAVMLHAANAMSADVLYENDFSTRTSGDLPPGAAWTRFKYTPGIPLADNYEAWGLAPDSNAWYTRPYSWVPSQDGWTKAVAYALRANYVHTTVSGESDPALVFSNKDAYIYDTNTSAADHTACVMHPLRNVFTNGMMKAQFDIRQPASYSGNVFCWFRFEQEYDMKINNSDTGSFPLEVGLTSGSLAGGWRPAESNVGVRVYYTFGAVSALHWYRYYITYNIDNETFEFDVYDLGTERISMDAMPSGSPKASRLGCFRHSIASRGGISGVMIRHTGQNTGALYGEAGYDDDKAYKIDNIKVAWQKPGTVGYVDCYRNDFTKSERRTIDGSRQMSHTYVSQEVADHLDFTYRSDFVRSVANRTSNGSSTATPYLTSYYDSSRADATQLVGIDGWRTSGHKDYKGCPVVTTNNANQMLYCASFGMAKQLMCQPITSGIVKFEIDQKMPAGWTGTPRCDIDLMSENAYEQGTNNTANSHYRFGLGAATSTGGSTSAIRKSFSIYAGGNYRSLSVSLKPLTWYRLQVIANLDTKKASLYVYEIGANAPAAPEDFDPGDTSNAVLEYENSSFETGGVRGSGIAAWGFTNFLNSQGNVKDSDGNTVPAENVAFHVDNVRFWKQNGDGWELVFKNDFSTSRRYFTRKSYDLNPTLYIDRPEYGEDGWASCPTYNSPVNVTGTNTVIQFRDQYVSVVHPLGRNIKSGKMLAQYDVRLPAYWVYDKMQFEFGGATIASASTATTPVRFNGHSAIRTGFSRGGYSSGSGGNYSKAAAWFDRGASQGGETNAVFTYVYGQEFDFNAHWIRVKIEADVSRHKFDVAYYDMGKTHPTFDTPEGTKLDSYEGADFKSSDEPISHFWIFGGQTWSYAPWRDDAPGALLIDNIKITHERSGMCLIIR